MIGKVGRGQYDGEEGTEFDSTANQNLHRILELIKVLTEKEGEDKTTA